MTTAVVNFDSLVQRRRGPPPLTSAVTSWNGLTGAVKGTLQEIWAFGAGDAPLSDNLFAFPSGNLRYVGSTATAQLPASGFFESRTTQGDPRVATDYFARYFDVGVGVGGTSFDQYDAFNPTWNGTFRGIGGLQTFANRAGFTLGTGAQTGPTPGGMTLARQTYWNIFGFFDGTDYWPLLDNNDGGREDVKWDLFNEHDAGIVDCGRLTGWGTWVGRPLLLKHGTTAAFDTQARFSISGGTAAGDGVGWFVRNGTDDPPYGIARWFWVGSGNASGWQFLSQNAGGTLGTLLSIDPVNGAVFNVPVTVPGPLTFADGAFAKVTFRSAAADLTVGATVNVPVANPGGGKLFYMTGFNIEIDTPTGGPGTTTAALDLHVNGGVWKVGFGSLSVATLTGTGPGNQFVRSLVGNGPVLNPAQALDVVIATPMGGYTTVPCRFIVEGYYA